MRGYGTAFYRDIQDLSGCLQTIEPASAKGLDSISSGPFLTILWLIYTSFHTLGNCPSPSTRELHRHPELEPLIHVQMILDLSDQKSHSQHSKCSKTGQLPSHSWLWGLQKGLSQGSPSRQVQAIGTYSFCLQELTMQRMDKILTVRQTKETGSTRCASYFRAIDRGEQFASMYPYEQKRSSTVEGNTLAQP